MIELFIKTHFLNDSLTENETQCHIFHFARFFSKPQLKSVKYIGKLSFLGTLRQLKRYRLYKTT